MSLEAVRHIGPIPVGELAERFGTTAEDPEFLRVIGLLVLKHFFIVAPSDAQ